MIAIIPCAGRGSRLGKIGLRTPKTMMYVNEKPVLGHIVDGIRGFDISEIVIVVGGYNPDHAEQIWGYVKSNYNDLPISFACQPEPLGAAHAFWCGLEGRASQSTKVLTLWGDGIPHWHSSSFMEALSEDYSVVGTTRKRIPHGLVSVDRKGYLVGDIREKPSFTCLSCASCFRCADGFYDALDKIIRYDIRTHGELCLADAINLMYNFGEPFKCVEIDFDHFTYARDFE